MVNYASDTQSGVDGGSIAPSAASQSQSLLEAVMAETVGMSMHNAISAQQRSQMVAGAAVTAACARMLRGSGQAPLPVVDVKKPPGSGDPVPEATEISKSNKEAQAAITALLRQAESSSKNAATAEDDLEALAKQASKSAPGS